MPSNDPVREITKVGYLYQIKGDPKLHLSECLLVVFPDEPQAKPGIEGVRCTCDDFYQEADS